MTTVEKVDFQVFKLFCFLELISTRRFSCGKVDFSSFQTFSFPRTNLDTTVFLRKSWFRGNEVFEEWKNRFSGNTSSRRKSFFSFTFFIMAVKTFLQDVWLVKDNTEFVNAKRRITNSLTARRYITPAILMIHKKGQVTACA